ncbi:MAG TPA: Hsp33 family molecular chaperone HslO [Pseudogracilibacillus sp.]|nr:Hsp33 family molecular chaperone HslO [Pseudogracilibacillus sp.]
MKDYLVKATLYDNTVRAYAAVTTHSVEEARVRQDSWATTTAALGRTMTSTVLMGAMLKGEDKLTVKIEGNGPIGQIVTDANAKGEVRGYVSNPHVDFDLNEKGKLDVGRAVGNEGSLSVVKDLGLKDYFTGSVPIVSGEIGDDFTYYFALSEQTPSAVGAGVLINPDHSVLASGGFIIQLLPGASEEMISQLEADINSFPAISNLIEAGNSPEEILETLFKGEKINFLETLPIEFSCECSKERIEGAIKGLGEAEIKDMIEKDKGAEATCHFCNEVYTFTEDDLKELIK